MFSVTPSSVCAAVIIALDSNFVEYEKIIGWRLFFFLFDNYHAAGKLNVYRVL